MRPVRILLLTPTFPPPFYGGQEAHALELAKALLAQGLGVRVLTKRPTSSHALREVLAQVPVRRLRPTGELKAQGWSGVLPAALFLLNTTARLIVGAGQYDVVLVSGFNLLPLAAAAAGLITRRPCVVRIESPLEIREPIGRESRAKMGASEGTWIMRLARRCQQIGTQRVARFVAISAEIRDALLAAGIAADRIVSVPNGIDTGRFAPLEGEQRAALRARLGLDGDTQLVVYTGRIAHSKGVMMLARSWMTLSAAHPRARLVLVGTGEGSVDSCESELRELMDGGRLRAVTLTGAVDNVHEWLQAADVFAFPSESEGFGLSILEAMSVGLPMICTRVGVAGELPQSPVCALLVEPGDHAGFHDGLRRLLEDAPLRTALAGTTRELVRGRFSMQAVAEHYAQLCAELVHGRSGPASTSLGRGNGLTRAELP